MCNKKKSSSSGDRQIRMKKETLETTRWREAERHRERQRDGREASRRMDRYKYRRVGDEKIGRRE